MPAWFADDLNVAARTLLAISPEVDEVQWAGYRDYPGIEHLRDFEHLAAGLDVLHRLGTVHCDIKPDNVRRYSVPGGGSGFVLVDADAATRLEPLPPILRTTPPYSYRAVREWNSRSEGSQPRSGLNAGVLRAQDRFGFALIVLTAVAGKDWVENNLLWESEDEDHRARRADHREEVRAALRRLWSDPAQRSWEPLIDALVAPFGKEIEAPAWSATTWVRHVLDATTQPHSIRPPQANLPFRPASAEETRRYARNLHTIQTESFTPTANKVDELRLGFEAVQRQAEKVAWRAAVRWAGGWAVSLLLVAAMLAIGAWVLGK